MAANGQQHFRNRYTGQLPSDAEWAEMLARAHHILDRWQYSSPEQMAWATKVDPVYAEGVCGTVRIGGAR